MKKPEISVIVPVYNVELYLSQCIDSILAQTYQDIEVICVNDGSTDHSLEILNEYAKKDNRVQVISREIPSGSAALPRNMGLEQAKGKYVICLDSDDYFEETMLEKLRARAEETNAEVVLCDNYVVLAETGEVLRGYGTLRSEYLPAEKVFSYKVIPDTIFQLTGISCWDKLVSREVIERHGIRFQENVPSADTFYFAILTLVLANRISVVEEPLLYYRSGRTGAQTMIKENRELSLFLTFKEINNYLMSNDIYEKVKLSWQNRMLSILRGWLYAINDENTFNRICKKYKDEWFKELYLIDVDLEKIDNKLIENFYSKIVHNGFGVYMDKLKKKLPLGSSVVIYGAGQVGKAVYEDLRIEGSYRIILWCDTNANKINDADKLRRVSISHPSEIKNILYDAIIITPKNPEVAEKIKDYLLGEGAEEKKIISLYELN